MRWRLMMSNVIFEKQNGRSKLKNIQFPDIKVVKAENLKYSNMSIKRVNLVSDYLQKHKI